MSIGKKRMGSQTFDQLSVGEIFKFDAEDKYTSMAKGPWVKLSARTYRHIEGDWSPVNRVGSIRALVRRLPEYAGGKRRGGKGRVAKRGGGYWTVIIPPAPYAQATEWHDTSGRAATLSRGAFATKAEATKWAKEHLRGAPYSLRKIGAGGKRRSAPQRPRKATTARKPHRGPQRAARGKRRGHRVAVGAFPRGYIITRPRDYASKNTVLWDVTAPNGEWVGEFPLRRSAVLMARRHNQRAGFGKVRSTKRPVASKLGALVTDINRLTK